MPVALAALAFTLGSSVALPRSYASIHPLGFEESFYGVFHQLYAPVEGFKHKNVSAGASLPYDKLMEISDTVLESSPKAAADLAHLKGVGQAELVSKEGWEEFRQFEDTLARNLNKKGVFFSPELRRKIYIVGAGLMWHQAQHQYDLRAPYAQAAQNAGGAPLETIEAEMRGWRAACSLWKAGNGMNTDMGGMPFADALSCDAGFPKEYYCKYHSAAESVILTTYRMKLLYQIRQEGPGEGTDAVPDPAGAQAVLETELTAYCAELERGAKGNPLSLEGLTLEWKFPQCVDKAVETVNAPGWKASKELCP
jgi:hypothetical protein